MVKETQVPNPNRLIAPLALFRFLEIVPSHFGIAWCTPTCWTMTTLTQFERWVGVAVELLGLGSYGQGPKVHLFLGYQVALATSLRSQVALASSLKPKCTSELGLGFERMSGP